MRMNLLKGRVLLNFLIGLMLVSSIYYLASHVMRGERGIMSLIELSNQSKELQKELDLVRSERITIESKVEALRSDSLDLDLLDEQARKIIGLSQPEEVVYLLDPKSL
jgi:cell division protein FtsB